jgi:hypothetical protein
MSVGLFTANDVSARRTAICAIALILLAGAIPRSALGQTPPAWPDQRRCGPFLCHADASLADLEPQLEDLARLPKEIQCVLGVDVRPGAIQLYALRDRPTYEGYLRRHFPDAPYRRALFIRLGEERMIFVQRGADLAVDLRHEAVHALLQTVGRIPLWLDEGLAVYFEVPAPQALGSARTAEFSELLRRNTARSIADLERLTDVGQMHGAEYQSAWAWTHFLLHGPPGAQKVGRAYFQSLRQPTDGPPLSQRLHAEFADLEGAFRAHFDGRPPLSDRPVISAPLHGEIRPK